MLFFKFEILLQIGYVVFVAKHSLSNKVKNYSRKKVNNFYGQTGPKFDTLNLQLLVMVRKLKMVRFRLYIFDNFECLHKIT